VWSGRREKLLKKVFKKSESEVRSVEFFGDCFKGNERLENILKQIIQFFKKKFILFFKKII
jgi:hypothetical protein